MQIVQHESLYDYVNPLMNGETFTRDTKRRSPRTPFEMHLQFMSVRNAALQGRSAAREECT